MKRWIWYLGALGIVMALDWMPFFGADVASLHPVEVIRIWADQNGITVQTDTGSMGRGGSIAHAFEDLENTTSGRIFLETAEFVLINREGTALLPELSGYLRPACGVCVLEGQWLPEQVGRFLDTHRPGYSLQDYRAGGQKYQRLIEQEGRMWLVPG